MSKRIEVSMVFVRNHETLWKSNDTRFSLDTVLPSGYIIPRMKISLGNTKLGPVSTTNAESTCIHRFFHCKRNFPGSIINYLSAHVGPPSTERISEGYQD